MGVACSAREGVVGDMPQHGLSGKGTNSASKLVTAAWVVAWMVLSVSIILVNKYVVAASGFSFPMTLAAWHMALGTATARCAVWALGMPDTIREHASPALYSQLASIGVLFAGVLVTSNASLMLLSVPAVQMLKAATPAVTYATGIVMGHERLAFTQALKVAAVCLGVAVASYGDITMTVIGFLLQAASIVMDAMRCSSLQRVLQTNHIDAGPLVTLGYVAPCAFAGLLLPVLAFEGPRLVSAYHSWRGALPVVLLSGVLASALNLVIFKIIRRTSALITALMGILKEWACILLAMRVYGTVVTPIQWLGYSIAISGLVWYKFGNLTPAAHTLVQHRDGSAKAGRLHDKVVVVHASAGTLSLKPLATYSGSGSNARSRILGGEGAPGDV